MRENRQKWMRNAAQASTIGIVLVVATFIGYAIGHYLDRIFGTEPWLMLLFTVMGIIAGFIEMFRIVDLMTKEEENDH